MSDVNLHDDSPNQDWQGGPTEAVKSGLDALLRRHAELPHQGLGEGPRSGQPSLQDGIHREFPVSFTDVQLEHVFEQARAALHKDGMSWVEACRLAERVRARVMGQA